ncbi:hypothetical protein [Legionella saoudiensis]|uniref:hypothetical protein n=1 Tax=Legionella saoudiensis TaxID=1750561 RepID=UPI000731DDC6|nr:hypothetical protein [Legionella saoudiensis]
MIKNVTRQPCLMTFISFLFLFSTNIFSKSNSYEINESINVFARHELLKTVLSSSNIYARGAVSCDLAQNIKNNEKAILKNTKPDHMDSTVSLIHLSKEINEKCLVISYFKKNILPIIKSGNLSATCEQDYYLIKKPQLLRINLVDLANENLKKLNNCLIKASIFVDENGEMRATTRQLECQINHLNVSFHLMSSFSVKNAITCVKSIAYLPEFIQPCKKVILSKQKKISLMLGNELDDIDLSPYNISIL